MTLVIPVANASTDRTPAGIYRMKLLSMSDATLNEEGNPVRLDKNGNAVARAKWVFEIETVINGDEECEEYIGREHWEWTTMSRHVKANMRQWAEALLDRPVSDDEPLGSADLIGKRAVVTIGPVANPQTGTTSIKVSGMSPFKRRGKEAVIEADPEDAEGLPF